MAAAAEDNLYISSRSWSPAIFMYRQNIFMHRQNVFIHKQNVFMHRRKENDLNKQFTGNLLQGDIFFRIIEVSLINMMAFIFFRLFNGEKMDLLQQVQSYWQRYALADAGTTVVTACSGGIDSLALLHILAKIQKQLQLHVVAAHFEHGIRGEESLEDARFVGNFCQQHNIDFFLGSADVPAVAREKGISVEMAARECRYSFLRDICSRFPKAVIATAHHKDDQAETVLLHLLRVTGLKGLGGIRPVNGDVIRPVLFLTKQELWQYCTENGLQPRHDSTNDSEAYRRNKVRLQLLPDLARSYNPNIVNSLCRLADTAAEDEAYLQAQAETASREIDWQYDEAGKAVSCSCGKLGQMPRSLKSRILQKMVLLLTGEQLSYVHIAALEQLLDKAATGTRIALPFGLQGKISYGKFTLEKNTISFSENHGKINININSNKIPLAAYKDTGDIKIALSVPGETVLPDGTVLVAEVLDNLQPAESMLGQYIYCDYDKASELYVRHRRPGDIVNTGNGHKKLKDYMIDAKIPSAERDKLWLLCGSGKTECQAECGRGTEAILWLAGKRRFQSMLVDKNTKKYLYITLRSMMNEG